MKYLIKKTIKVIRSCKTVDQLQTAVEFVLLASKRYGKLSYNKPLEDQFWLDMIYLLDERAADMVKK